MPYNRTETETAVKRKLIEVTKHLQTKFSTTPPTAVSPDTINALIATAVVEAVDVLVKTATISIPEQLILPTDKIISPAGTVTGTLPVRTGNIT